MVRKMHLHIFQDLYLSPLIHFLNFLEYFLHLTIVGKLVPKTWKTPHLFFCFYFLSIALDISLEKGSCSVFSQQMIFIRKILLSVLFLFVYFQKAVV